MAHFKMCAGKVFFVSLILLVLLPLALLGKFPVADLPAPLLADANRVLRVYNTDVIINGPGSFKVITEEAITVLNENGKGPDWLVINYDSHTTARFIEGSIYDASGKEIKKIRRRDLLATSNFQDFSLFEDSRVLLYRPLVTTYPYTVHCRYEQEHTRGMYYSWTFSPLPCYNTSAEEATLKVTHPETLAVIYRSYKVDSVNEFTTRNEGSNFVKQWRISQKSAVLSEHQSPGIERAVPWVGFATTHFEFAGYQGSNSSWNEFGRWVYSLIAGRD